MGDVLYFGSGRKEIGAFDLIVAGERATDGDTAQVGPGIASWLIAPWPPTLRKSRGSPTPGSSGTPG